VGQLTCLFPQIEEKILDGYIRLLASPSFIQSENPKEGIKKGLSLESEKSREQSREKNNRSNVIFYRLLGSDPNSIIYVIGSSHSYS